MESTWCVSTPLECQCLAKAGDETAGSFNFWHSARWSPDGACVAGYQEDGGIRVMMLPPNAAELALGACNSSHSEPLEARKPELLPELCRITPGEPVYSWAWHPHSSMFQPEAACIASSSRGQPVHLWHAVSGQRWSTYLMRDEADEVATAHSLCFNRLYAGRRNMVAVWDINRPGHTCEAVSSTRWTRRFSGIFATMATDCCGDTLAVGSFKGDIGIVDLATHELVLIISGHEGGITHLQYSRCGNYLYSGARGDPRIGCWDIRHTGEALYMLCADDAASNQRIAFDIEPCGRHLLYGGVKGTVTAFDLATGNQVSKVAVAEDTVAAMSMHPVVPLMLTGSGHRQFRDLEESSCDAKQESRLGSNTLSVWRVRAGQVQELPDQL